MPDALRRALRGFLQIAVVQGFIQLYQAFATAKLSGDQVAAITLAVTPLLVLVQNVLEDNTPFPSILKAPASAGENPVPDPGARLEQHP